MSNKFLTKCMQRWEQKYGKEMSKKLHKQFCELFGGDMEFETEEELLIAISVLAQHLKRKTGEGRYDHMEKAALGMLSNIEKGLPDEVIIKNHRDCLGESKGEHQ